MQEFPPRDNQATTSEMTAPTAVPSGPRPASEAPDANASPDEAAAVTAASGESIRDSGAGWFFWIAAISLINTVLLLSNSNSTLALGLGFTILVDAFAAGIAKSASGSAMMIVRVIELILDALILGFFVMCGLKGRQGKSWAFVVGGLVLFLDTLFMLFFKEWISVALHLWALISIYAGWNANKKLLQAQSQQAATDGSPWAA